MFFFSPTSFKINGSKLHLCRQPYLCASLFIYCYVANLSIWTPFAPFDSQMLMLYLSHVCLRNLLSFIQTWEPGRKLWATAFTCFPYHADCTMIAFNFWRFVERIWRFLLYNSWAHLLFNPGCKLSKLTILIIIDQSATYLNSVSPSLLLYLNMFFPFNFIWSFSFHYMHFPEIFSLLIGSSLCIGLWSERGV